MAYDVVNGPKDAKAGEPYLLGCWRINGRGVLEREVMAGAPDSQYEPVSDDINH